MNEKYKFSKFLCDSCNEELYAIVHACHLPFNRPECLNDPRCLRCLTIFCSKSFDLLPGPTHIEEFQEKKRKQMEHVRNNPAFNVSAREIWERNREHIPDLPEPKDNDRCIRQNPDSEFNIRAWQKNRKDLEKKLNKKELQ